MKSILVTGASSGIGAAIARLAIRDDYAVGLCYRSNKISINIIFTGRQAP